MCFYQLVLRSIQLLKLFYQVETQLQDLLCSDFRCLMDFLIALCSLPIQSHKYRLLQERYLSLYDDDDDDDDDYDYDTLSSSRQCISNTKVVKI